MAATAAYAQPDDLVCRNGDFPREQSRFGLAKVLGPERLNFLSDTDGCPSQAASCRQRAYVVAGDLLLTGRSHGAYVCAFFPGRGGGSAGWVPRERLAPAPAAASPPLTAWLGRWADGDDAIALSAKGALLSADGEAYWPSAHTSRPGGPNLGELSGAAKPDGGRAVIGEADGCQAVLTLVGDLLVVADNNGCGGMNVSFTGVYRRK
ncbi:MAG: hypothetical protein JO127_00580 [Caulobacteraceae bacterium]|nr:hypothetical protein [Caulobacteraceae bacterium]